MLQAGQNVEKVIMYYRPKKGQLVTDEKTADLLTCANMFHK